MARKGRVDRGLMQKIEATGKAVWSVRLWHNGKERRFGSFKTKTEARQFYKAKQDQRTGRFFPEQYQRGGYELISAYIEHYMRTITIKKPTTVKAERYFAPWWTHFFEGQRLNAITSTRLEEARQQLLGQGLTPSRVNRYMAWLRHVLNLAVRDGKLPSNPVCKLRMYREAKGRTRFLSVEEEESKLYPALGPLYASWARLAILTGLRQDEQFSLRWTQVDLEQGRITLPATKAGDCQYVTLNEEAKAILRRMDSWKHSTWVFPSENPATHMAARNFYVRVWVPAVCRAGIEWATWHDLRHTLASRAAMNGESDTTIAALLRHSTTALVKRYAHLSPSHLKAAVEGVASFGKRSLEQPTTSGVVQNGPACVGGTVTKTGLESQREVEKEAEVIGKIGAPDTN